MSDHPTEHSGQPGRIDPPELSSDIGGDDALGALAVLSDGVVIQRAGGEITYSNAAAERILGLTRAQVSGRTGLDPGWRAVHEDGSPFPGETHPAVVTSRTGEAVRGVVMGVHRPDGSLRWVSVRSEPIPGRDGRPASVLSIFSDITDRRREEERYGSLFLEMLNGFALHEIVCDESGKPVNYRFLAVNPAFERMTGLSASRIVGRTVLEVLPSIEPRWIESYGQVALTGKPIHFENYAAALGKHFEVTAYRPAPGQFACIFADVSERKAAEEELQENRQILRNVLDTVPQSIFWKDTASTYLGCNRAFARAAGLDDPGEVVGKTDFDLPWLPEETEAYRADDALVVRSARPKLHIVEPQQQADGLRLWIDTTKVPLLDARGVVRGVLGIFDDITERKEGEEALQRSEEDFRYLFEKSAVGRSITFASGEVRTNEAFARMIGYERSEMQGLRWQDVTHPDDVEMTERAISSLLSGEKESVQFTKRFNHRNGSTVWVELYSTLRRDASGAPLYLMTDLIDITERRRVEAEIHELTGELERRVRERTAQLEESNRELEAFSYSVSHDLRAPLRAIEGFSGMLVKDSSGHLNAEDQRRIGVVRTNARTMSLLIDDLLTFSRTGRHEIRHGRVVMNSVARSTFEELAGAEDRPGLSFRLGALPDAEGDSALLRQVWINLLSNALKFTAREGKALIEVDGLLDGRLAVYHVRDNGVGFDPKYGHKLFGVFQRLHGPAEYEGTGIGLALVRRIVERHGGRVWAEGEVGKGATFSFSLPAWGAPRVAAGE